MTMDEIDAEIAAYRRERRAKRQAADRSGMRQMIVVLDTNVIVSALITPGGVCGRILAALAKGHFAACVPMKSCSNMRRC